MFNLDLFTLQELSDKYPLLNTDEIADGVETSIMDLFQFVHKCPVTAITDQTGIHVTLLRDQAETLDISKLKRRMRRRLIDQIELELMERQTYAEATKKLRGVIGSVVSGEIRHILPNGTLIVLIDLSTNGQPRVYYAECPLSQQPAHEQGKSPVGSKQSYMVIASRAVKNNRHAKVQIILSRVARELPARMLTTLELWPGIRCLKRELRPGHYRHSIIVTPFAINKEHVAAVGKELREHIQVIVRDRGSKPGFSDRPQKRAAKWRAKKKNC